MSEAEGIPRSLTEAVANDVARSIVECLSADGLLWSMIDREVVASINATEDQEAILWLTGEDGPRVSLKIFGCDELLVLPFVIPEIEMPVSADAPAQIREAREEISALRAYSNDIAEIADRAEHALNAIMS